jgi:CheY-like chemotaxis protein
MVEVGTVQKSAVVSGVSLMCNVGSCWCAETCIGEVVTSAVLIVDDDPPLLGLLQTLVRRSGDFEVVTCRDGAEAIEVLSAQQFDVVLLDLMMPKHNGFEVIDYLNQHRPTQLRVVLVLTAATSEFSERLDPSIVHAVVAKPFDADALMALIRGVVHPQGGT